MIWVILAIVLMVCGLWMCVRPYIPPMLLSYAAMWVLKASGHITVPNSLATAWGITVIILLTINYLQPQALTKATNGTCHFTLGALTGAIVGMTAMTQGGIVIGASAGLVLGALVYSRTASGMELGFPSVRFFQYLCAKGFPIAVAVSIICITALLWILRNYPAFALENMSLL